MITQKLAQAGIRKKEYAVAVVLGRLIGMGIGAFIWLGLGGFIMAQMINFEI